MAQSDEDKLMKALKSKQKAKSVTTPEEPEQKETAVPSPPTPPFEVKAEHTVIAGENLSRISEQYYNTPNLYMKIYEANKDIIGDNPSLIRVGQVLKIPK